MKSVADLGVRDGVDFLLIVTFWFVLPFSRQRSVFFSSPHFVYMFVFFSGTDSGLGPKIYLCLPRVPHPPPMKNVPYKSGPWSTLLTAYRPPILSGGKYGPSAANLSRRVVVFVHSRHGIRTHASSHSRYFTDCMHGWQSDRYWMIGKRYITYKKIWFVVVIWYFDNITSLDIHGPIPGGCRDGGGGGGGVGGGYSPWNWIGTCRWILSNRPHDYYNYTNVIF